MDFPLSVHKAITVANEIQLRLLCKNVYFISHNFFSFKDYLMFYTYERKKMKKIPIIGYWNYLLFFHIFL